MMVMILIPIVLIIIIVIVMNDIQYCEIYMKFIYFDIVQ